MPEIILKAEKNPNNVINPSINQPINLRHMKGGITCSFNSFPNNPRFLRVCSTFVLENTAGKGEIARNEQFLFFSQCFLPFKRNFRHLQQIQKSRLRNLSVWKSLKFVVLESVNRNCYVNG